MLRWHFPHSHEAPAASTWAQTIGSWVREELRVQLERLAISPAFILEDLCLVIWIRIFFVLLLII